MVPNRHCKHFRPQAAGNNSKNENFNFGNYAANKFQACWQQQAAGAVTEGGQSCRDTAARRRQISRSCNSRIALHNSGSQPGSGSCCRPKSFPATAAPTLHYIRAGRQTHTHIKNCRRIICLIKKRLPPCSAQNYKDGRKHIERRRKSRRRRRETNNKQNSKKIS